MNPQRKFEETMIADWSELRRRIMNGDTLSIEEQAHYEAECAEMDRDEAAQLNQSGLEKMRLMRVQIAEAEAEQERLRARQARIKAKIVALEARLDSPTRQALGIGN